MNRKSEHTLKRNMSYYEEPGQYILKEVICHRDILNSLESPLPTMSRRILLPSDIAATALNPPSTNSRESGSNETSQRSKPRRKYSSKSLDYVTSRNIETEAMRSEEEPTFANKAPKSPPPSYEDTFAEECDLTVALHSPGRHSDRSESSRTSKRRTVSSSSYPLSPISRPSQCIMVDYNEKCSRGGRTFNQGMADGQSHRRSSSRGSSPRSPVPEPFIINSKSSIVPGEYSIDGLDCVCFPLLTEDQARAGMRDYEKSKFKLKRGVAEKCSIMGMLFSVVFRYMLKTLFEARRTEEVTVPYRGGSIDSPELGSEPDIWDIPVKTPKKFEHNQTRIRVPHTSYVCECDTCMGVGRTKCKDCGSFGKVYCTLCMGGGIDPYSPHKHPCPRCFGQCQIRCYLCGGSGTNICRKCEGRESLLCYKQLVVEWIPRVDKELDQVTGENWDFLYRIGGTRIFHEESKSICPITRGDVDNEDMRSASKKYIELHNVKGKEKIWQRQTVSVIPINTVQYEYKGNVQKLHFVGKNKQIHAENYPKKFPWNLR